MSKLLEQLLLEADTLNQSVEKNANKNQKSVIKNTTNEEVRRFIKEAVDAEAEAGESDDSMDYDETSVDSDTGATPDGDEMETDSETDFSDDTDSEDTEMGDEFQDEEGGEGDDMPIDIDAGMENGMGGNDEVMDLTNATEEEVLSAIKNMPEDGTLEIVKQPSYQVTVKSGTGGANVMSGGKGMGAGLASVMAAGDDEEIDVDMDSEDGEMPNFDDSEDTESDDMESDDTETDDMDMESEDYDEDGDDEMNESASPFDKSVTKVSTSTGDKTKAPFANKGTSAINSKANIKSVPKQVNNFLEGCQDEAVYEEVVAENKRMKHQLRLLVQENKKMKANEAIAVKTLRESMARMKALALTNSNLAYVSKLFTEHSTTKQDKLNILKKFDNAKTTGESEIVFRMLKESLEKRTKTPMNIDKSFGKTLVKENTNRGNQKNIIKEEKVYLDPEQQDFMRLAFYTPQT